MDGQLWLFFAERQRTVDMADEDEGKANSSAPGRIRSDSAARKEGGESDGVMGNSSAGSAGSGGNGGNA